MNAAIGVIGIIFLLFLYLALLAFSVTIYVLNGIGLMKMAKSCGLSRPWRGFVPFAGTYMMGQLAEQNPSSGKKSWPWRHIALIGEIVIAALALAMGIFMFTDMAAVISAGGEYSEFDILQFYGSMFGMMAPLSFLSTVYSVVVYIINWKIFSLFAPQNTAVIFLVLSILFNITPILFFILRNRQPANRPGPSNDQWA